jgi:hypothetical protein
MARLRHTEALLRTEDAVTVLFCLDEPLLGERLQATGFSNRCPMPVTSTHREFTLSENRCRVSGGRWEPHHSYGVFLPIHGSERYTISRKLRQPL